MVNQIILVKEPIQKKKYREVFLPLMAIIKLYVSKIFLFFLPNSSHEEIYIQICRQFSLIKRKNAYEHSENNFIFILNVIRANIETTRLFKKFRSSLSYEINILLIVKWHNQAIERIFTPKLASTTADNMDYKQSFKNYLL